LAKKSFGIFEKTIKKYCGLNIQSAIYGKEAASNL
jgi:hypothetical protein